jgi:hypothetical protein
MAERIGNVLYWLGCLLATSMLAMYFDVYFVFVKDLSFIGIAPFYMCALFFFLAGLASRYILAAR